MQLIHPVALIVADLYRLLITHFEFLPSPILEDRLTCLARAFDLLAPLFMLFNLAEKDKLFATVADYANDLQELLEDVGAGADA